VVNIQRWGQNMVLPEEKQFRKNLEELALLIEEKKSQITNEENTKHFLIIPFIRTLGYNTDKTDEVYFEFPADLDPKKGEKIDIALLKDIWGQNKPIIFIEVKPVNTILVNFEPQLKKYFQNYNKTRFGVITNGEEYRFFSDTQKPNVMDDIPFFVVNFSKLKESDFKNLLKFKKENYNEKSLCDMAIELHYLPAITEAFKKLYEKPSEKFIEVLFRAALPDKQITLALQQKLPDIVKEAMRNVIVEKSSKMAPIIPQQENTGKSGDKSKKELGIEVKNKDYEVINTKFQIETTDEELTALNLIKTILEKKGKDFKEIKGEDTINYFSINRLIPKKNRLISKWFIRLVLSQDKKSLSVRLNPEKVNTLLKGFSIDVAPAHLGGGSRIYFDSIKDILKMQELTITCFDEVNK